VALTSILLIAVSYLFLLIFYTLNTGWSTPLTLSPSQEHVLSFQPQVANLEASLLRQRVELKTAESKFTAGSAQLEQVRALILRIDGAQRTEARALGETNASIKRVLADKRVDISLTEKSIADAQAMLKSVEAEVSAGLITRDQAQTRRITLQAALNAATDAKAQAIALQEQARAAHDGAATLSGGSSSLQALQSIQEAMSLRTMAVQLTIDTETARMTIDQLKIAITDGERVLDVAKTSPYHLALRQSVDVLFVPYDNLKNAKIGESVYDCYLQVIACHKVGTIQKVYEAEEYARHPLFKTDLKGRLVGVKFDIPDAAKSQVVFIGHKPLFL
jgi:predicted  nucleic acid-binding Zn-ribbon protein